MEICDLLPFPDLLKLGRINHHFHRLILTEEYWRDRTQREGLSLGLFLSKPKSCPLNVVERYARALANAPWVQGVYPSLFFGAERFIDPVICLLRARYLGRHEHELHLTLNLDPISHRSLVLQQVLEMGDLTLFKKLQSEYHLLPKYSLLTGMSWPLESQDPDKLIGLIIPQAEFDLLLEKIHQEPSRIIHQLPRSSGLLTSLLLRGEVEILDQFLAEVGESEVIPCFLLAAYLGNHLLLDWLRIRPLKRSWLQLLLSYAAWGDQEELLLKDAIFRSLPETSSQIALLRGYLRGNRIDKFLQYYPQWRRASSPDEIKVQLEDLHSLGCRLNRLEIISLILRGESPRSESGSETSRSESPRSETSRSEIPRDESVESFNLTEGLKHLVRESHFELLDLHYELGRLNLDQFLPLTIEFGKIDLLRWGLNLFRVSLLGITLPQKRDPQVKCLEQLFTSALDRRQTDSVRELLRYHHPTDLPGYLGRLAQEGRVELIQILLGACNQIIPLLGVLAIAISKNQESLRKMVEERLRVLGS